MQTVEIRERFLSFFEERGHRRMPSASLVPSVYDPSVLLTTAGMQPFRPYFTGEEEPPSKRLTSCQKSFRTTDIENVGMTHRHLTFFEMLGNFSIGDYFKQEAVEYALDLSTNGFGFDEADVWITVFGGDEELGLGPDEQAIDCWRSVGVPDQALWAVLRALPRPRARLRRRERSAGRRHRALPRVLEPRVHAVRAPGRRVVARTPGAEHRHRDGPRAHGGDPAGRRVGVRDRRLQAARRTRGGVVVRPRLRPGLTDHSGAAHPRRPRPRRRLPAR